MKFTVDVTNNTAVVENFVTTDEEQQNLKTAVENMAKATMAAMAHFAGLFGGEQENDLLNSLVQYMQLTVDEYTRQAQQGRQVEYPYEEMEGEFINWIYGQGYDDPYAFADRYENMALTLDFSVEGEDVSVYFADEKGNKQEEIGRIPVYLFEDEPEMASAQCIEYTSIAVLCLDKLYSGVNNPLRNLPVTELEKRIKEKLQ